MKAAADKVNKKSSINNNDVEANEELLEFIRVISVPTAKAKAGAKGEKFLAIGRDENGELMVTKIGIVTGSGGEFSIPSGTIGIAHVHYKGIIEQNRPGPGDHSGVKLGISMFMINRNGSKVVEIGRKKDVEGKFNYRTILGGRSMEWKEFKGAR